MPDFSNSSFSDLKKQAIQRVEQKIEGGAKLHWQPLGGISRDFIYSVMLSEDSTFQAHDGVNYEAMLRAFARNWKAGEIMSGGSTITQQTVKNVFLTPEQSYLRKLKELFASLSLEKKLSKNEVLELYLNVAEFGPNLYGVRAAAKHYFRKRPKQINAAEGAFMALMLPSPRKNYYRIFVKKNLSSERKRKYRRVLRDMFHEEYITAAEYGKYRSYNFFPK